MNCLEVVLRTIICFCWFVWWLDHSENKVSLALTGYGAEYELEIDQKNKIL